MVRFKKKQETNGLIVLLTDFGTADAYAGIMKGVILSIAHQAQILDLTHGIEPQNILQGARVLKSSYPYFPKGSVFICVVDPGVGTSRDVVCVRTEKYFFVGPDNGLLFLALGNEKMEIRSIQNSKYCLPGPPSPTFHGRDIMAPVAARLVQRKNKMFSQIGPLKPALRPWEAAPCAMTKNKIQGKILYFDSFGNAITNIEYENVSKKNWARAKISVKGKRLGAIRKTYLQGPRKLCALFNSSRELEIAQPCGSARAVAGLKAGDKVTVRL